jgi:hypothetical protein
MNKIAFEYLKELQQQLITLSDEQQNKLGDISNENFRDDVSENIFGKIDDVLYEIETIMTDVEEGYYNNEKSDFDEDEDDTFEDF